MLRLVIAVLCGMAGAWAPAMPAFGADDMVKIPAGSYQPLYRPSGLDPVSGVDPADPREPVASFELDRYPVTNAGYLAFVTAQPRWRRSRVPRLFADDAYLASWSDDLDPGPRAPATSPVVGVSWFAARAYCDARGKRLPTTAEWEYAASVDETNANGRPSAAFNARILAWYSRPVSEPLPAVGSVYRNAHGVHDLHGLVWEWTLDFNNALVTGESRADSGLDRRLFCGAASIGAADTDDYAAFMRYAFRSGLRGDYTVRSLGFRCARTSS